MVTSPSDDETTQIRALMQKFVQGRLQEKFDKLKPDEHEKHAQLEEAHRLDIWLADAARRASQLQLASHILKPIHPDARGTNLYVMPTDVGRPGLVGTHSLGTERANDVVGNAAALDVFKFLSLTLEGRSLLQRALDNDEAFRAALSDDPILSNEWRQAFASLAKSDASPASHTLAKQVYFPLSNGTYHLLAPLYPTSLVHEAQRTMREDRFGEAAKAARQARKDGESYAHGYREYPNLAIRKFGGTKPQNISQLNSERYGENWLLPSLPPHWQSPEVRTPWDSDSVFETLFGRQKRVQELTQTLRRFLESVSDYNNVDIRRRRAFLVDQICEEALFYAARLRALPPGWSADPRCLLHEAEQLWLDPLRVHDDEEFMKRRLWGDWPVETSHRFGNWLNTALAKNQKKLSFGDAEHAQWKTVLMKELDMFREVLEGDRD